MSEIKTLQIVLVVYPDVTLLDVTGPAQAFANAGQIAHDGSLKPGRLQYNVILASRFGGSIKTDTGVSLDTTAIADINISQIDTLLVSGGTGVFRALEDQELIEWYRAAARQSRRFGSTCMGAFFLAQTGLADTECLTTHWRWADKLVQQFPRITVDSDRIFISGPRVWSSAGVTSGIDMSLAMIEKDLGHKNSIELAKAILVYYRRPGNQAQYSNRLKSQLCDEAGRFDDLHEWIADNIRNELPTETLAHQQGMSVRNFGRLYKKLTGMTPAKAVEEMRVEECKRLLTREGMNIGAVARATGFRSEVSMKRAFMRSIEMTPSEYQSRYLKREPA